MEEAHIDYDINSTTKVKKKPKYQIALKKNLYDNNIILDHEGNILCRCSKKKINWYVSRGLATIVKQVCSLYHMFILKYINFFS